MKPIIQKTEILKNEDKFDAVINGTMMVIGKIMEIITDDKKNPFNRYLGNAYVIWGYMLLLAVLARLGKDTHLLLWIAVPIFGTLTLVVILGMVSLLILVPIFISNYFRERGINRNVARVVTFMSVIGALAIFILITYALDG